MQKTLITLALTLAAISAGPLRAAEKTEVQATVQRLVEAFNKGDTKSMVAGCADQMCIIDEFAPYEWHGAGTTTKWLADYDADARANGITEGKVSLGKPRHVDVNGARAYVVAPANYTYLKKGKAMEEIGATWTFTLQKVGAEWRITGWCWAKS